MGKPLQHYNRSKNIFWQWTKWRFHHAMNTFQQMFWRAEFSLLQLVLEHSDFWAQQVVVWHSGKALVSSNEVNLRWAQLVLGWVTMPRFNSWGQHFILVCNHPPRWTQPSTLHGTVNEYQPKGGDALWPGRRGMACLHVKLCCHIWVLWKML